jgi:hypothetical protein
MERAPLYAPLTPTQKVVVSMVGRGFSYVTIADTLAISVFTAKRHAEDAAAKIPGDLPTQMKLIMWWRGASCAILDGSSLQGMAEQGDALLSPNLHSKIAALLRQRGVKPQDHLAFQTLMVHASSASK